MIGWVKDGTPMFQGQKSLWIILFLFIHQKYVWQDNNGKDIKGWALGDYAAPFNGNHDIQFTKELLELIQKAIPLIVIAFLQQDIPGVGI